ncbi:unnamed protein product [Cylindrotheca closterium]|uniref:Uncharacterized protein n=1 Tax=Cylindrotheca closterium TaxID=2856 RepID=A0AAD2GBP1_9STRA|nr:unnamed protein product [Cylindrotheca closterium]
MMMGGPCCNVSFNEEVKVLRIPSIATLLDVADLKTDLWYSKAEIKAIIKDAKLVVQRFDRGMQRATDNLRGLERGTDAGFYQSQKNKREAYKAVIRERMRQERLGIDDATGLQKAYATVSLQCAQAAVDTAILDSLYAHTKLCPDSNNCFTRRLFTSPASWFGFQKTPPLWQSMNPQLEVSSTSEDSLSGGNMLPVCLNCLEMQGRVDYMFFNNGSNENPAKPNKVVWNIDSLVYNLQKVQKKSIKRYFGADNPWITNPEAYLIDTLFHLDWISNQIV